MSGVDGRVYVERFVKIVGFLLDGILDGLLPLFLGLLEIQYLILSKSTVTLR